jgi:hypothetical protein
LIHSRGVLLNLGKTRSLIRPPDIVSTRAFVFVDATGRNVNFSKFSTRDARVALPRRIRSWRQSQRPGLAPLGLVIDQDTAAAGLRAASLPEPSGQVQSTVWPGIALALLAIFFSYFAVRVIRATQDPPRGDFGVYYRAGQDMAARRPIYYLDLGIEETFKSAPAEALAVAAIQWLPPKMARLVWYLADLSLLGVIFAVGFRILYPDGRLTSYRGWLALATFAITIGYVINQFQSGQPTTCWVALCMLTYRWVSQGKRGIAGLALAAAICIKVVPLCFVPHLIVRGRKPAAASLAGGLLALLLLPAVWVGWRTNAQLAAQWVTHLHGTLRPSMLWEVRNQSLFAILFRFLSPNELGVHLANLDMATVGYIWLGLTCLLAVVMNGWFLVVLRNNKPERRDAAILSLLLIFMTVCNPLAWKHNSIALVFPYFFALDSVSRSLERRRTLLALIIPSVLLMHLRVHDTGSLLYFVQICGGRFWGNVLLAVAVMVAYYAANKSRIRIAEEPDAAARPGRSVEVIAFPRKAAA